MFFHCLCFLTLQQEYKDRRKNVNKLRAENEKLRKKLLRFSKKCEKLTDENESLMVCHLNPYLNSVIYLPVNFI